MPTPKATEVRAALQALLRAMSGTYAPDAVVWVPLSTSLPGQLFNSGMNTVIGLALDVKTNNTEVSTFGMPGVEMPITIIAATKYEEAAQLDPFTEVPKRREDVQDELEQAVLNQIDTDPTLGRTVIDVAVPDTDQSYETTGIQGWAVTVMQAIVIYKRSKGEA